MLKKEKTSGDTKAVLRNKRSTIVPVKDIKVMYIFA